MPSKFYDIAAAGRPTIFIGAEHGEIGGILEKNGCGFTVRPGDGEALAGRILALAGDREQSLRQSDVLFGRRVPTLSQPRPAACELANKMPHVDVGVP